MQRLRRHSATNFISWCLCRRPQKPRSLNFKCGDDAGPSVRVDTESGVEVTEAVGTSELRKANFTLFQRSIIRATNAEQGCRLNLDGARAGPGASGLKEWIDKRMLERMQSLHSPQLIDAPSKENLVFVGSMFLFSWARQGSTLGKSAMRLRLSHYPNCPQRRTTATASS